LNANANYSTPLKGDTKLDFNIGGSFLQKGASGTGYMNYTGQRFSAGISQYLANGPLTFKVPDFPTNRNSSLAVTQFNAGTALAFADGFVALSRPIDDSFALVVSKKNDQLRYLRAYKESFKNRYNESLGSMPAVVPSLRSYKETDIHVDIYKKNSWNIEASEQVKVRPTYRSGTLIEPKTIVLKASSKPLKRKAP
jgi:outer membrane usher protein